MEISEVRIKLMESSEDRLRGFCSVTFDGAFVVRDLKIIEGNSGPFVAMPSRKLTANCKRCRTKNHLRANYCNNCGQKLKQVRPQQGHDGRAKLYADIAHPINAACREMIQNRVIEELEKERQLSAQPGYCSRYDEAYDAGPDSDDDDLDSDEQHENAQKPKSITQIDSSHAGPPRPRHIDHQTDSVTELNANSNANASTEQSTSATAESDSESKSNDSPTASADASAEMPPKNKVSDDFGEGIFD